MKDVLDALHSAWMWAKANPTIAWPILTAILTTTFKPRTPEAYARLAAHRPVWFFTRAAALLQLIGALGLDPVKAAAVLIKLLGGKQDPVPVPVETPKVRPETVLPPLMLILVLSLGSSGCALFTKGGARTVLDIAQSVCIVAHSELPDSDVANACGLAGPFLGPMRELLTSSREASAKAAKAGAAKCQ